MSDGNEHQTDGRRRNAAQPVGEHEGTQSKAQIKRTGERERRSAGPDGPDARVIGDAAKRKP